MGSARPGRTATPHRHDRPLITYAQIAAPDWESMTDLIAAKQKFRFCRVRADLTSHAPPLNINGLSSSRHRQRTEMLS